MEKDLAYLLGAYLGDGHVDYQRYAYQFILSTEDRDFCEICSNICFQHFGNTGRITPVDNYFKLVVCCKSLCDFLLYHCCSKLPYKDANKFERKGKMPLFSLLEEKLFFIQGLMDADGWISKKKNKRYIKYDVGFKNTSSLSPNIYDIAISTGLKCGQLRKIRGTKRKTKLKVYKRGKDQWEWSLNTWSYITKVGFRIRRKQQVGEEFLDWKNRKKTT